MPLLVRNHEIFIKRFCINPASSQKTKSVVETNVLSDGININLGPCVNKSCEENGNEKGTCT